MRNSRKKAEIIWYQVISRQMAVNQNKILILISIPSCLEKKKILHLNTYTENNISVKSWTLKLDGLCKLARKAREGSWIYLLKICSGLSHRLVMLEPCFVSSSLNMLSIIRNFRISYTSQIIILCKEKKTQSIICFYSVYFN